MSHKIKHLQAQFEPQRVIFNGFQLQKLAAGIIFQQNSTYSFKNVQLKEVLNHDENLVMKLRNFDDRFLGASWNFGNQPKA